MYHLVQGGVREYTSDSMHKLRIKSQWLVLLEISHQAEHQLPRQDLPRLPTVANKYITLSVSPNYFGKMSRQQSMTSLPLHTG